MQHLSRVGPSIESWTKELDPPPPRLLEQFNPALDFHWTQSASWGLAGPNAVHQWSSVRDWSVRKHDGFRYKSCSPANRPSDENRTHNVFIAKQGTQLHHDIRSRYCRIQKQWRDATTRGVLPFQAFLNQNGVENWTRNVSITAQTFLTCLWWSCLDAVRNHISSSRDEAESPFPVKLCAHSYVQSLSSFASFGRTETILSVFIAVLHAAMKLKIRSKLLIFRH